MKLTPMRAELLVLLRDSSSQLIDDVIKVGGTYDILPRYDLCEHLARALGRDLLQRMGTDPWQRVTELWHYKKL